MNHLVLALIPVPARTYVVETVPITDYYGAILASFVAGVFLTLALILPFFIWQYFDFDKLKKNLKTILRVERIVSKDGSDNTILVQNDGLLPFRIFDAYIEVPTDNRSHQYLYSTGIVRHGTVFPWRRENRLNNNIIDFCICPETVIYRREVAKLTFKDDLTNSNLILCLHTSSGFAELGFEELKKGKTVVLSQEYSYQKRHPR